MVGTAARRPRDKLPINWDGTWLDVEFDLRIKLIVRLLRECVIK